MSTSPVRYQPSPSANSEIRSLAIAKLKRAASLPRTPDGRRPHQPKGPSVATNANAAAADEEARPSIDAAPSAVRMPNDYGYDGEEFLSPSPGGSVGGYGAGAMMQRSNSASSSYHIPTPPHIAYNSGSSSPFYTAQPSPVGGPGPDWAAYQLAQSYLPSISPVPAPPSSFPSNMAGAGRNTPSPLPSLGELRNLSRSNSAAARAKAMDKLTGGHSFGGATTPTRSTNFPNAGASLGASLGGSLSASAEDVTLSLPGSRPLLRAGTIGVPRMFGMPATEPVDDTPTPIPDTKLDVPRPRLQRSFTVSSSNMAEERRSVVGRRMVERLAGRRAARQQEEAEVHQLWQERRHTRDGKAAGAAAAAGEAVDDGSDYVDDDRLDTEPDEEGEPYVPENDPVSTSAPTTAVPPFLPAPAITGPTTQPGQFLGVPDRTSSRSTQRSDTEAFEFAAHLGRSLSTRTARGEQLDNAPDVSMPSPLHEDVRETGGVFRQQQQTYLGDNLPDLDAGSLSPPTAPFATTPTRHVTQESTSSQATVMPAVDSPSADSSSTVDGIDSANVSGETEVPPNAETGAQGSHHWAYNQPAHASNEWDNEEQEDLEDEAASGAVTPLTQTYQSYGDGRGTLPSSPETGSQVAKSADDHSQPTSTVAGAGAGVAAGAAAMAVGAGAGVAAGIGALAAAGAATAVYAGQRGDQRADSSLSSRPGEESPEATRTHKKNGSVSKAMGRAMFSAFRKGSASSLGRGSLNSPVTSPPMSPRNPEEGFAQVQQRTSQASSTSGSQPQSRASPTDRMRHQPSNSSMAPSTQSTAASANSLLIQHQLSAPSAKGGFLPRADINDPRIHSSRLSPFPGITTFEQKRAMDAQSGARAVQTHPRGLGPSDAYGHNPPTKRGALMNALASRSSAGSDPSRGSHHSNHSPSTSDDYRHAGAKSGDSQVDYSDDSQASRDHLQGNSAGRPEIPSYMMSRRRAPPPPIELGSSNVVSINDDPPTVPGLSQRSTDVLKRMDAMLAESPDSANLEFLEDPPRKLLLAQQVLQVVNANTCKDRYLFLFNDILVIAKPLITHGVQANLDMKFVVKSVVGLDKLLVSGMGDEPMTEPPRHPMVQHFIQQFAEDGLSAVHHLVEQSNPRLDTGTLATLILKTPELDKPQIGILLAADPTLLLAFMDRFNFGNVRIDDALRMFLLSIRLPNDISAAESLLRGFAAGYYAANEEYVTYDQELAEDLVLSTLELNDMLYSTFGFAFPNHAISRDTFVAAFQSKDPNGLVPDDLLEGIYTSIRQTKLVQSLAVHEAHLAREVTITPQRLPSRLTYNEWSDKMTIAIPKPDASFQLRFHGMGLEFDPPVLDFANTNEQSFRVRGVSLGPKSMLFERIGVNAALYGSIGSTRTFNVERGFMRHTFQVAFVSHLGGRRKYCFSVPDAAARQRWATTLGRQVWLATETRQQQGKAVSERERIRRVAEAVSLQVLRDALIAPEDKSEREAERAERERAERERRASHTPSPQRLNRMGSVSIAYAARAATDEVALGPLQPTRGHHSDSLSGFVDLQTGKELVLTCRQNSLLPSVLELLHSGTEPPHAQAHPHVVRAKHLAHAPPVRSADLKAIMHDRRL